MKEYEDKKIRNCSKEGLEFEETEEEKKEKEQLKKDFEDLCKAIKETLSDKIEKCVLGYRLDKSPCVLVTSEWQWTANLERIMKAQALQDPSKNSFLVSKKTLEINPYHPIIKTLLKKYKENQMNKTVKDLL